MPVCLSLLLAAAALPAGRPAIALGLLAAGGLWLCLIAAFLWHWHRLRQDRARLARWLDRCAEGEADPAALARAGLLGRYRPLADLAHSCARVLPRLATTMAMLEWTARRDPMTDLLNAASFRLACQGFLGADARNRAVLLFLSLDGFRQINRTLGHHAGDQLLGLVADRLKITAASLREGRLDAQARNAAIDAHEPLVGRLGGDEFAILLPGHLASADIERFVQRLQRVIGEPCHIGPHALKVQVTTGIACSADTGPAYDQLLAAANTAMHRARARRPDSAHAFYTADMRDAEDDRLALEIDLRQAIRRSEFRLHFQPQLALASGRIAGVEALIRWHHPTRGLVPPLDFIPFAEAYGIIDDIGDWVIVEAIRTAARWHAEGRPLRMSINVSPKQFQRVELIPTIRACLSRFGLPAHLLEIEITEAAIMRGEAFSLERIEGLRRDGVAVALDDFGTGYSNLAQLMALPMDRLKLDKSLIDAIATDRRQQVMATSIIAMARELGFEVVAEGVESEAQLALLRGCGVDHVQGYLISPPRAESELFGAIDHLREVPDRFVA